MRQKVQKVQKHGENGEKVENHRTIVSIYINIYNLLLTQTTSHRALWEMVLASQSERWKKVEKREKKVEFFHLFSFSYPKEGSRDPEKQIWAIIQNLSSILCKEG